MYLTVYFLLADSLNATGTLASICQNNCYSFSFCKWSFPSLYVNREHPHIPVYSAVLDFRNLGREEWGNKKILPMSVWPYLRLPTNARIFVAPLLAPYISETTVTQWANSALGLKTYPIIGPNVVQAVITPTTTIEWASRCSSYSLFHPLSYCLALIWSRGRGDTVAFAQ